MIKRYPVVQCYAMKKAAILSAADRAREMPRAHEEIEIVPREERWQAFFPSLAQVNPETISISYLLIRAAALVLLTSAGLCLSMTELISTPNP
jgi:hypothetical protein